MEDECGEDTFCYESNPEHEGKVLNHIRNCRSPEDEVAKDIRQNGEACDDDSSYCNQPLCNNKTKLPEKYDVLIPEGTPYG